MRLILFDIDGTLLSCNGQTRPLLRRALLEVFDTAGGVNEYDFAGKTDDQIVFDVMLAAGLSRQQVAAGLEALKAAYLDLLEERLDRNDMRLLPAVRQTIERLVARQEASLGLLTGNWRRGARIKLSRFGLNRYFDFGAFGDGHTDRCDLPPVALEEARRATGLRFSPTETLVVGDTRHDVACARAHGMAALGVATGGASAAELEAAGADWVIPDFTSAHLCPPVAAGAAESR